MTHKVNLPVLLCVLVVCLSCLFIDLCVYLVDIPVRACLAKRVYTGSVEYVLSRVPFPQLLAVPH